MASTAQRDPVAALTTEMRDFKAEQQRQFDEMRTARKAYGGNNYNYRPAQDTMDRIVKSAAGYTREHEPFTRQYRGFGDFIVDFKNANGNPDRSPRLATYVKGMNDWRTKAAPTGLGETVAGDGGVLVPPQFVNELLTRTYSNDLLSRTRNFPMTSNKLDIPAINETSRADGSRFGGLRAYTGGEADTMTASKPNLHKVTLAPEAKFVVIRVTDDLLNDSGIALETFLNTLATMELEFLVGREIIRGSGAGEMVGILNAPCLVTQDKETGQAAGTIVHENVVKMWSRMFAGSYSNAVWLVNQDVLPSLYTMTLGGGVSRVPSFMPPGGLSESPYATLLGRPVIPIEFCSTLGTVGDILLVDLGQYLTGSIGGVVSAVSMHVYFLTNEQVFRFRLRIHGLPWWTSAMTPYQGTNTVSPFVALATRS